MSGSVLSIEEIEIRAAEIAAGPAPVLGADADGLARDMLAMGERIVETWLAAKDRRPDAAPVEGFRLLGLHRAAARGDASFNACRETCRELVFHYNLIVLEPDEDPDTRAKRVRMMAMVLSHLALFIGGKLQVAGLGEFCCSSRPLHSPAALSPSST